VQKQQPVKGVKEVVWAGGPTASDRNAGQMTQHKPRDSDLSALAWQLRAEQSGGSQSQCSRLATEIKEIKSHKDTTKDGHIRDRDFLVSLFSS
jgi:hypothetical protein